MDSAERHFADLGVNAPLEAVARDAGVGSATLYRHFPSRDALLAELLERRATHISAELAQIEQESDSGVALERWLGALQEFFGAFEGLPDPLRRSFLEEHNPLRSTCVGFIATTDRFLEAAQRDGLVRSDTRGRDLFIAALALSWAQGSYMADSSSPENLRGLIRDGFTVRG